MKKRTTDDDDYPLILGCTNNLPTSDQFNDSG